MKNLILIFIFSMIISCSFDNKTGIWKDASNIPVDKDETELIQKNDPISRYEDLAVEKKFFNEEKDPISNYNLKLEPPILMNEWKEQYGVKTNNISNISYSSKKILISKSPKLSRRSLNKNIIFYQDNLISSDHNGKIFMYSLNLKKKTFEYNFYKKNFKKFKKEIFISIKENILYAADNLGYIYAIDLNQKSLIWAKNFGIPFRSNIKIVDDQIFLANQDNLIYSVDSKTGNKKWQFATATNLLKLDFINNFAIDELNNLVFFLNTSGELYSINYLTQNVNWILNFKNVTFGGDKDIFDSNPIVIKNNSLVISTNRSILSFDSMKSSRNWLFSSNTNFKPIVTDNHTFIFSKYNLLICIENKNGKVVWSKNIYNGLEKKIKNKIGIFYDLKMVNNEVNLFSKNGYLLTFNYKNGNRKYIKKISKNGISSKVFFLNNYMYLIDGDNKLLKFN